MSYTYDFPRPAVTVDCVIFHDNNLLLIKRGQEPYKGKWALPGGFVDIDEDLEDAAKRELKEETGIEVKNLVQLRTFGDIGRDPRGRVISVVHGGSIHSDEIAMKAGDDADEVQWFQLTNLPPLAFDHDKIIRFAIDYFKK